MIMINERKIRIVGFDGVTITQVTINEFNLLKRLYDELWHMNKLGFRQKVLNGNLNEIAEDFLNIYDSDAAHNSIECLDESEIEILKTLYAKLKCASAKQIVYIVTTLINSGDFLYMFRFDDGEEPSEINKKERVLPPSEINPQLLTNMIPPEKLTELLKTVDLTRTIIPKVTMPDFSNIRLRKD
jgi:hypothetical protein